MYKTSYFVFFVSVFFVGNNRNRNRYHHNIDYLRHRNFHLHDYIQGLQLYQQIREHFRMDRDLPALDSYSSIENLLRNRMDA